MSLTTEQSQAVSSISASPVSLLKAVPSGNHEEVAPVDDASRVDDASPKSKKFSEEQVQKIVRDINDNLAATHTELNFSVDKATDKMVLKIINSKTHEVIRQIPAEDALRIAARISKLLGIIVDTNA